MCGNVLLSLTMRDSPVCYRHAPPLPPITANILPPPAESEVFCKLNLIHDIE